MKKLVIVGSGGFAREVLWLLEEINKAEPIGQAPYQLLGFITNTGETHMQGLPVLGDDEWAFNHLEKDVWFVLAIGNSELRAKLALAYLQSGLRPARLVHPSVHMSDEVQLGGGVVICAGAVLTTNIVIGEFALININATIGHDSRLGDFATVHPGANINGNVKIGDMSEIGSGAVILPKVEIGDHVVIGAGAVVTKNLLKEGTYIGVPARELASLS